MTISSAPRMSRTGERGFSLVELAIALTVIGILLAGIMKGRELYDNARATRIAMQMKVHERAIIEFHRMYRFLPGDIRAPGQRIPGCNTSPCNDAGDGNGVIDGGSEDAWAIANAAVGETHRVWVQLAKAGLIDSINRDYSGTPREPGVDYPATPWNLAAYDVYYWAEDAAGAGAFSFTGGHYMKTKTMPLDETEAPIIPAQMLRQVDIKVDDGDPSRGRVLAWYSDPSVAVCAGSSSNVYPITAGRYCEMAMRMDF